MTVCALVFHIHFRIIQSFLAFHSSSLVPTANLISQSTNSNSKNMRFFPRFIGAPALFLFLLLSIFCCQIECATDEHKHPESSGASGHSNVHVKHDEKFDVIVIGAGVIGSGIAYKLAESGKSILLIEKEQLCHEHGSSHGKSRIIRYTHSNKMWLPLVHDAYAEWEKLEKESKQQLVVKNGLLTMDTDYEKTKQRVQVLNAFKLPNRPEFEIVNQMFRGQEITDNFPHLQNYGQEWTAVYEPSGATLLADKCLQALQKMFKHNGGTIKDEETVKDTKQVGDNEVEVITATKDGTTHEYHAKHVVFALGGWLPSHEFLKDLPITTETHVLGSYFWDIRPDSAQFYNPYPKPKEEPGHGEHGTVEHHGKRKMADAREEHHSASAASEMHSSKKQKVHLQHSSVVTGSASAQNEPKYPSPTLLITNPPKKTAGASGKDAAADADLEELYAIPGIDYENKIKFCIHKGQKVDEMKENNQRKPEDWMWEIPQVHLKAHLPAVQADTEPPVKTTCIYTMTKDEKFIVDRHPKHRNILIAGGFSGTGFKFGPTIGKLIAHLIQPQDDNDKKQEGQNKQNLVELHDQLHFDLSHFSLTRKMDQQSKVTLRR